MALKPIETSNFCEDLIDELNDSYFEFCSQYDESIQYVLTQSQLEESQHQNNEQVDDSTEQPKLDFQTAFMQSAGISPVETVVNSNTIVNVSVFGDFDSQTDFEAKIRAVMIQNPHLANAAYKPPIDAFLECSQYFETIKASPKRVPKKAKDTFGEIRFNTGPQVLMIVDILKINIDPMNSGPLSSERMLYGKKFRSVMFYGRCEPHGIKYTKNDDANDSQSEHIKRKYIMDDGSAKIVIHISRATNSNCRGKIDSNSFQLDY